MTKFVLKYPDGKVQNLDYLPDPANVDPAYKDGHWVGGKFNYVGMEVYHLEFPSVNLTFQTTEESVVMPSNHIEETKLPSIPEVEGKIGSWIIPDISTLYTDVVIHPTYKPIVYRVRFDDGKTIRERTFTVDNPPKFPQISQIEGYSAKWETTQLPCADCTVKAIYTPIKVNFVYDGTLDVQTFPDITPPALKEKPGYIRKWEIPKNYGHDDLTISPIDTPIEYNLTLHISEDETKVVPFSLEKKPVWPSVEKKIGYSISWNGFDQKLPQDQEATLEYVPISIKFYSPDDKILAEFSGTDTIIPPEIKGYTWPSVDIKFKDIDVYPIKRICFALFYANGTLLYCVPYTITDRHFIDEMFTNNTVPKSRGRYGEWVRKDPLEDNTELYIADYDSHSQSSLNNPTSSYWDISKIADHILEHGSGIVLDGKQYDLFATEYSKYTGITANNCHLFVTLPLIYWLRREHIPYEDHVKGWEVRELKDGRFKLSLSGGMFWIGYSPDFDNALTFLNGYDIYFRKPKKNRKVCGLPARYLSYESYFDDPEEAEETFNSEFPLIQGIPSRFPPESKYKYLYWKPEDLDLSDDKIKAMEHSNDAVLDVFNVTVHPECEFTAIDESMLELTSYLEDEKEYTIPSIVLLSDDESQRYTVKSIGNAAFKGKSKLESVYIPESVETICDSAFEGCQHLSSVIGGYGVKSIGFRAFVGCDDLRMVDHLSAVSDVAEDSFPPSFGTQSENDLGTLSLTHKGLESDEDAELLEFIAALDPCEKNYLRALCLGEDINSVLSNYNRRKNIVEIGINEKSSDILDDDEMIVEGEISEDYLENLTRLLGD